MAFTTFKIVCKVSVTTGLMTGAMTGAIMGLNIFLGFLTLVAIFFAYLATREGKFYYEVSENFKATPEQIFPYLSNLQKAQEWSPFEKADPNMKREIIGVPDEVGSRMIFSGNRDAGAGVLEFTKIVPNELVELRLIMTAPLKANNIIKYHLRPIPGGTQFTWSMEGDGGYVGKVMTFFIDCEKMITDQFRLGMKDIRLLLERNPN